MVNIRKIAKWYNLKWSNTLSKKLPKFQHDLLVISNRLINNADFMKDEKLEALRQITKQTRNPYYLNGLLKVFGYHWQFKDIWIICNRYQQLRVPFHEDVRDHLVRFCVFKLKKPPLADEKPPLSPEDKKYILDTLKIYNECNPDTKIPYLKDDDTISVTLADFIHYHQFRIPEDFTELTGRLITDQQYEAMVELYDQYYHHREAKIVVSAYRAMISFNALEKYDRTAELMNDLLNYNSRTAASNDLWYAILQIPGMESTVKQLAQKGLDTVPDGKELPANLKKVANKHGLYQYPTPEPKLLKEGEKRRKKLHPMVDEYIDDDGNVTVNPDRLDKD